MMPSKRRMVYHEHIEEEPLAGLDNFFEIFGTYLLVSTYTGPLVRIREGAGSTEQDFYADPRTGFINPNEVATFLAGATGYVTVAYGQTGTYNFPNTSASGQPYIDVAGVAAPFPSIGFFDSRVLLATSGNLRNFARNSSGVTVIATSQQGYVSGGIIIWVPTNSGQDARLHLGSQSHGPTLIGRRTDTDANQTIGPLARQGRAFAAAYPWGVRVGRADYANAQASIRFGAHATPSDGAFQTAGVTDDTVCSQIRWGSGSGNALNAWCTSLCLISDVLTDPEVELVMRRFRKLIPRQGRDVFRVVNH